MAGWRTVHPDVGIGNFLSRAVRRVHGKDALTKPVQPSVADLFAPKKATNIRPVNHDPLLTRSWRRLLFFTALALSPDVYGGVVADATHGSVVTPAGRDFGITGGTRSGGNLLHSFSTFSLADGDSATFARMDGVTNILARVTGPDRSEIYGTIRSTTPGANLFLINPKGVLFGPNATLEIDGSFTATTADYVRLNNGGRFDARTPANDVLTAEPISAFGFLNPKPAAIMLDRAQLGSKVAGDLHLVGGDLILGGAALDASSKVITLLSVRSSGEVAFDLAAPGAGYRTAAFSAFGNIAVAKSSASDRSSRVDTDGLGGGKVIIRGGTLAISGNSSISASAQADSASAGGDITIQVDKLSVSGSTDVGQSKIEVVNSGDGPGGNLRIDAGSVAVSAGATINCDARFPGLGSGGKLTLTVDGSVTLSGGGFRKSTISTDTTSEGAGGRLELTAKSLSLTDNSKISSDRGGTSTARGGDLDIAVKDFLSLEKGGFISADVFGTGNAGVMSITAAKLRIEGAGSRDFTGIRSDVAPEILPENAVDITGHGGKVMIQAGEIFITSGGEISASTYAPGDAGLVDLAATASMVLSQGGSVVVGTQGRGAGGTMRVRTPQLLIDGRTSPESAATGFIAQSKDRGSGRGGSIEARADSLTMLGGAVIEATTGSENDAGSVSVTANRILLDGTGASFLGNSGLPLATAISARTVAGAPGNGGDVFVTARDSITLRNRGEIEAATEGAGRGGNVTVRAGSLFASGSSFGFPSGVIARGSDGARGAAGSVRVELSGRLMLERGAEISSNHLGTGAAGNVSVVAREGISLSSGAALTVASTASDAGILAVDTSTSIELTSGSSITASAGRNGGNISLQARDLFYLRDSSVTATAGTARSAGATAGGAGGNIFIDPVYLILDHGTISANAALGAGGNILLRTQNFLRSESAITATGTTAGTVQITAPPLDLANALATLAAQFVDASTRLQERCALRLGTDASSFLVLGRGSTEALPEEVPLEIVARIRRPGTDKVRAR